MRRRNIAFAIFLLCPVLTFACEQVNVVGTSPKATWCLTVAATPEAHRRGLQNVRKIAPDGGMLFLFDQTSPQYFWMQNTPLALDIIFIDASGIIRNIIKNTKPFDETILSGGCARYVIEVQAGASKNVAVGDRVSFNGLLTAAGEPHGQKNSNCM